MSRSRAQARRLSGLAPPDVLPVLPRRLVVRALRDALDWYRANDRTQAVLAGCRAWAWATNGRWLSKGDAATWAIARLADPTPVDRALEHRDDPGAPGPTPPEAAALLDMVQATLEAAATGVLQHDPLPEHASRDPA
jgi:hypothetical protein